MRRVLGAIALLTGTFVSLPAEAHFHLDVPADTHVQSADGTPQKTSPCGGSGTPSNIRTKVQAGSQLTVMWTETVAHPGHFRISFAKNRSELTEPVPVVNNNNCESLAVQDPVSAPVLADGVAEHNTTDPGTSFQQTITIPSEPCEECTLQVIQFMADHSPSCFYHHCARIKIVTESLASPVEESVPDPFEVAGTTDGGAGDPSTTDPTGTTTPDAGKKKSSSKIAVSPTDSDGCNSGGSSTAAPLSIGMLFALALLRGRRRRPS